MRPRYIFFTTALVITGLLLLDEQGTAGSERRKPAPPEVAVIGGTARKDSVAPELAKLETYMTLAARKLDRRVQAALSKIDGTPRRLLALRHYLQRPSINGTWAWTAKEVAKYRRTIEFRIANAEVDKVIALFQKTYPGLKLRTSKVARSLDEQVALWNATGSVAAASSSLMRTALKAMTSKTFPDTASKKSVSKFQTFLTSQPAGGVPTVSVPGLSEHGQLRAYDFIIWQGDKILAGSDGASIRNQWVGGRWGWKLRQIVFTASNRFEGPLISPNEPWHYGYIR